MSDMTIGIDCANGEDMTAVCIRWIPCGHVCLSGAGCPYCRISELKAKIAAAREVLEHGTMFDMDDTINRITDILSDGYCIPRENAS